jgi:RNA polymerase sigma-70 factor, ECF subfamily
MDSSSARVEVTGARPSSARRLFGPRRERAQIAQRAQRWAERVREAQHWVAFILEHAHSKDSTEHRQPLLLDSWDWPRLRTLAVRECRRYLDADTAEDATQVALLRAWRHRDAVRGDPGPWLRVIARREALRMATAVRAHEPADEVEPSLEIAQPLEERHAVRAALGGLAPGERSALFLHYWLDLTTRDVAETMSLPEGTIKTRLARARTKLARTLTAEVHPAVGGELTSRRGDGARAPFPG